jgi:hypothetical protein
MYFNAQAKQAIDEEGRGQHTIDQLNQLVHPEGHVQLQTSTLRVLREILTISIHSLFVVFLVLAVIAVGITLLLPKKLNKNQNV